MDVAEQSAEPQSLTEEICFYIGSDPDRPRGGSECSVRFRRLGNLPLPDRHQTLASAQNAGHLLDDPNRMRDVDATPHRGLKQREVIEKGTPASHRPRELLLVEFDRQSRSRARAVDDIELSGAVERDKQRVCVSLFSC
ncbi:MAG: hypothetical protein ACRDQZ_15505 [Mycobacteriales bacterium]